MAMQFQFEKFTFDTQSGLTYDEKPVHLPPKERGILEMLVQARGEIVSKDALIAKIWNFHDASDESISRAVHRLREAMQKIGGPVVIETIYKVGYRLKLPVHITSRSRSSALMESNMSKHPCAVSSLMSAREMAARRNPEDVEAAADNARVAISADGDFSAAWSFIAELRVTQVIRSFIEPQEGSWLAAEAAQAALLLNPESSTALAVRGWFRVLVNHQYDSGLNDLDRAIALDPDYWYANLLRGCVMQAAGRHAEAIAMVQRALELNPVCHSVSSNLALQLMYAGRLDEALEVALELVRRLPTMESAQAVASIISSAHGRHEDAIHFGTRAYQLAPLMPIMHTPLIAALAFAGRFAEAREALRQLQCALLPQPLAAIAVIYMGLGDREAAISHLLQACGEGVPDFAGTRDDPRFAALRGEPVVERAWATIWQPGELRNQLR